MEQCTSRATRHSLTEPTAIVTQLGHVREAAPHRDNLQFRIILRYQWRAGSIAIKRALLILTV
jgi:hypothetical protein